MVKLQSMTMSILPEVQRQLDSLADAQGLSRSQLLQKWIAEKLGEEERNLKVFGNPVIMRAMTQAFADPAVLNGFAGVIGEKLEPDQLELFHRALKEAGQQAEKIFTPKKPLPVKKINTRKQKKRGGKK